MVRQCFARGRALDELSREQEPPRFGTRVHFWPDPEVFGSALRWDRDALQSRLEQLVALREGFSCRLSCALLDFEVELDASRGLSTLAAWQPDRFGLHEGWIACEASEGPARAKLVLRWERLRPFEDNPMLRSFCNLEPTSRGTHVLGFERGLGRALAIAEPRFGRAWRKAYSHALQRAGLHVVLAVELLDPSYESPVRDNPRNPLLAALVERALLESLPAWFEAHPDVLALLIASEG